MVNSRLGRFSAAPSGHQTQGPATLHGAPLLPKLRGHFAEFLDEGSLARLWILSSPTCVGLRYGHLAPSLEAFLGSVGSASSVLYLPSPSPLRLHVGRFSLPHTLQAWTHSTNGALRLPSCVTPSFKRELGGSGISTASPSPTPPRPRLRSRLTLGGRAFPRKP